MPEGTVQPIPFQVVKINMGSDIALPLITLLDSPISTHLLAGWDTQVRSRERAAFKARQQASFAELNRGLPNAGRIETSPAVAACQRSKPHHQLDDKPIIFERILLTGADKHCRFILGLMRACLTSTSKCVVVGPGGPYRIDESTAAIKIELVRFGGGLGG